MADFSTDEKTNVLFKNFIGVPNTKKDREWYQESYKADDNAALSSGHALNYNNSVDLENVWAADISTNFSASNESVTLNMYVPGTYTVGPVSRDELGSVLKVEKLKLQRVESGNNQSWYCLGNNSVNVLKNIIPFNYKESGSSRPYAYILYNGPTNEMAYGATGGNWMIDHKSGVVYIPDASGITNGIDASGLYLTFYKYIGEPLSNIIITDDNSVKFGVLKNKYEIFKNEKRMIKETFPSYLDSSGNSLPCNLFGNRLRVHGDHVAIAWYPSIGGCGLYNVHSGEEIRHYTFNRDFAINDKYLAYSDWSGGLGTHKVVVTSLDTGEEVRTITGGYNYFGTSIEMTNDYLLIAGSTQDKIDIYDLNNSFNLISTKEADNPGDYAHGGGFSLVMDGDYIASVSYRLTIINNNYGGVYVHTFSGDKDPVTTLIPTTTFQPYDTQQAYFGYNGIAIGSGYIAVGAAYYDISGSSNSNQGAVFIYKINGDKWNSLFGSFTPPDTVIEGDDIVSLHFGRSVAISDGYLMVGSYKDDKGVKIYNLETLELVQEVTNNDNMDRYGGCVSAHNGVLVISDNSDDIDGYNTGSVYAYTSTTKSNVQLLTNQLPRLHVGLGGNVGIGTTEPSYKLDVNGDARIRGNIMGNTTFNDDVDIRGNIFLKDNVKIGVSHFHIDQTLVPNDAQTDYDSFGMSVAISGNYAIVGTPYDDDKGSGSGSAYIFNVQNGTQVHKLVPNDAQTDYDSFGMSVAISGNYAIVGTPYDDDKGADSGSAYIFNVREGTEVRKLVASDGGDGDRFGMSVAISGNYAIVGAPYDNDGGGYGSAYIFNVTNGNQLHNLTGSGHFGWSVAISGNYAIVGEPYDDVGGNHDSGSAYIFNVDTGTQVHKLVASDGAATDKFGSSVAISGNYAIVGAPYDNDGGNDSGSAYIFNVQNGTQVRKLVASDWGASDYFGMSVAISGNYAMVSAPLDDDNGANNGSVYIYNVHGEEVKKILTTGGGTYSNTHADWNISVAIDGNYAMVGQPQNDNLGTNKGNALLLKNDITQMQITKDGDVFLVTRVGNVGIGTSSPNAKLEIKGDSLNNGAMYLKSYNTTDKTFELRIRDDTTSSYPLHIGPINSFDGININNSNGNVGIGTNEPRAPLHIQSNGSKSDLIISDYPDTNYHSIFTVGGQHYDVYYKSTIKPGQEVGDGTTFRINYYSGGNVSLCGRGYGSVGIGETGSTTDYGTHKPKLTVRASTSGSIIVWRNMSDTRVGELYANSGGNGEIYLNDSTGTQKIRLTTLSTGSNITGSLTVGGSNVSSDDRLKHNEKPITNALDIINKLEAKQYFKTTEMYDASHDFELDASGNPLDASGNPLEKGKDYRIENGFIAQDLLKIPELSFVVSGGDKEVEVPIYEKDASGIVLDESGNIAINKSTFTLTSNDEIAIYTDIYEEDPSGNRVYKDSVYKRDASGNYELDASGEKIVDLVNEGGYKLDKEDNVMDETGSKIMDKDGNVLDASGNKNQVDVKKEIKSQPYGVDYMSICVLQMRAIQELQVRLAELEGQ